jgi:hypothetical protein
VGICALFIITLTISLDLGITRKPNALTVKDNTEQEDGTFFSYYLLLIRNL